MKMMLLLLLAASAGAQETVDREIVRLETTLKTLEAAPDALPKDVLSLFEAHRAALERAKKAPSPEYRLYRLRDAFVGVETLAFMARHKVASVAEFETLWKQNAARFEKSSAEARGSVLQRALVESSATRAGRLYRASLPYARASAPWSGVYYLGEAEGNLRFRDFVQSIADAKQEPAPSQERVTAMYKALERDTLTFFSTDATNQQVVPVSVRLKETRELLDAGRIAGATLLLVEARAALSRRGGPKGTYPAEAAKRTGSIATMLQGWADDEQAPMSGALRDEVVPFHGALFLEGATAPRARAAQVTVTLVRWPYT
ncbi:MAG TPA: hypothetical protein VF266_05890 [Thermoanaerobaculia bacterium]